MAGEDPHPSRLDRDAPAPPDRRCAPDELAAERLDLLDLVRRELADVVLVDARQRTSLARVWAAGDIVRPALPSIAVATGGAALAVADLRAELKGR